MDGVVPDAINWNPDKYLGDPVGLRNTMRLAPKSKALDLTPQLKELVDPALVETLYDTVAADMAAEIYSPNSMVNAVVLLNLLRLDMWILGESK